MREPLDNAGNRTKVVEHNGRTVDYTYDDLHRLTSETIAVPGDDLLVTTFTMDKVGNRLTKEKCIGDPPTCETTTYTYNDNNQLITETSPSYAYQYFYDTNGNTVERHDGADSIFYDYNDKNRLVKADTGTNIVEYAYDVDGIRVQKTVDGAATNFLVDKNRRYAQVLEERDAADVLLADYVFGNDLISLERSGVDSFFHYDGLGSTRALSDGGQVVSDSYDYEAYGELLASAGSTQNSFLYSGEQFDNSPGFYYLRARYYNPTVGRFQTADTHPGDPNHPLTLNKYLYANSNPVVFTDPSGKFSLVSISMSVAIVGILTSIAIPAIKHGGFGPVTSDSRDATRYWRISTIINFSLGVDFVPGKIAFGVTAGVMGLILERGCKRRSGSCKKIEKDVYAVTFGAALGISPDYGPIMPDSGGIGFPPLKPVYKEFMTTYPVDFDDFDFTNISITFLDISYFIKSYTLEGFMGIPFLGVHGIDISGNSPPQLVLAGVTLGFQTGLMIVDD